MDHPWKASPFSSPGGLTPPGGAVGVPPLGVCLAPAPAPHPARSHGLCAAGADPRRSKCPGPLWLLQGQPAHHPYHLLQRSDFSIYARISLVAEMCLESGAERVGQPRAGLS